MKGLEFLKNAKLAANETVKPATARTLTAKSRNPETADIRVYKDGSVYPSVALVAEFNLNYVPKDTEPKGTAFDVFKSTDYINTQSWPADQKVIFIAAVDRAEGKAELFGRTTYNAETHAPSDVLTQGAATFGKELLEYISEVYGETIAEPVEGQPAPDNFIDLVIVRDSPFNTENGIYFIPKTVSRGVEKGKADMIRRENITLFPFVPLSWVTAEEPTATVEAPLGEVEATTEDPELETADAATATKVK